MKKLFILFFFLTIPALVIAQASGGQIKWNKLANLNKSHKNNKNGNNSIIYKISGSYNGYDYVDLGLSVKWATCNVGSKVPEARGNHYAWGETTPKNSYTWETYKWCNGSSQLLTKYNYDSKCGVVDNKLTLDLDDDAARVNWGGPWRTPTLKEWQELLNDCAWTWTKKNGVQGYCVRGKNGNSIFLPVTGYRNGSNLEEINQGNYWSSTLHIYNVNLGVAKDVGLNSGYRGAGDAGFARCIGQCLRPVCP